jgi:phage/conjugal plasmid C-4 type zinc finger TraR family protein
MSRGFRDSDTTQAMSEQAVAKAIGRILERDGATGRGDGLCVDCGKPIDPERLEVLPDAPRCLRCQTEWEQAVR